MSKKTRDALKAERKKFDAWAKVRSQKSEGDWVLVGGHDGEERWAWEAWKGRAELAAAEPAAPQASKRAVPTVAEVLAAIEEYASVVASFDCWTGTPAAYAADEAEAKQKMEAAVRALAGEGASS